MVFSANHVIRLSSSSLALLHIPLPGVILPYLKASTVPFTYIAFVSMGEHKVFSA